MNGIDKEHVVGSEQGRDPIIATVSEYKGVKRVDIRRWYTTAGGEKAPGRQGISMTFGEWKDLEAAMVDIHTLAAKEGAYDG